MRGLTYCVLLIAMVFSLCASIRAGGTEAIPLVAISGDDLKGNFVGVIPEGIDLSADNSKVAVVFEVGESPTSIGIWAGVWDLNTKKLLKSARIDGPFGHDDLSNPQFRRALRFASDKMLVVQTGPRISVVEAATLAPMFSMQPSKISPKPLYGEVLRSFDVSPSGERLAVLTAGIHRPERESRVAVKVVNLSDGSTLAEWTVTALSRHISISPDGTRIALDRTGKAGEFSVFESLSGKLLRNFTSGFPTFGAGNIAFIDNISIAALPEIGTDADGKFFGSSLKVFNADSGSLTSEIGCGNFGSTASLTVASRARLAATVNAYQTPKEVRSDGRFLKSKPKLVLFDLNEGLCRSILKEVPHGQFRSTLDQYSLRLSPDGTLIALFEEETAKVYRVSAALTTKK